MNHPKIFGFDPSFETMGAALFVPMTGEFTLHSGNFDSCLDWLAEHDLTNAVAVVENPALNKNTFGAWGVIKSVITKIMRNKMTWELAKQIIMSQVKKARNVGENQAAAKYLIKQLTDIGIRVYEVKPSDRQVAYKEEEYIEGKVTKIRKVYNDKPKSLRSATKTNREQFEQITGYPITKRSNEHSRDAGTLVAKRSMTWFERNYLTQEVKRQAEEDRKEFDRKIKAAAKAKSK